MSFTSLEPSHLNYKSRSARERGFPFFKRPEIVASFTVDANRKCIPNDRSQLFFVRRCPSPRQEINLNLGDGYQNVIKKPDNSPDIENIDHILRLIVDDLLKYRHNNKQENKFLRADVVAWRGLLRQLMTSPYEEREGWTVLATRFKGTVYLLARQSAKQLAAKAKTNTHEMQRIFSYGFKFEQFQQTKCRNMKPDISLPVNEAEEFGCMFEGNLDGTQLLYGAEMDGIDEDEDVDLATVDLNAVRFVELKVNRRPNNHHQERNFYKFKTRNWWAQCFLVGVENIQVGVRTDAGVVDEIYTTTINELIKHSNGMWMPSTCMQFLDDFLQLAQQKLANVDCPHTVYMFDFDPEENRRVRLTTFDGPNEHSFLPDWYINAILNTPLIN